MSSNPSSPLCSSPASTSFAPSYLLSFTSRYLRLSQAAFVISDYLVRKLRLAESALLTSLCYWHEFVAVHGMRKVNEVVLATTCVFLAAKVEHAHFRLVRLVELAFDLDASTPQAEVEQWCRAVLDVELVLCDTINFDFVRFFPMADTLNSLKALAGAGRLEEKAQQAISTAVRRVFLFSFVAPLCTKVSMRRLCTSILYIIVTMGYRELVPALQPIWSAPEAELPDETELEGITNVLMDVFAYLHKKFGVPALDDINEARCRRRQSLHGNEAGVMSSVFSSASTDFTPLLKMAEQ
ncbi:putative cyclin 9 [Leptomonas pyrrhocoris]|uniref:Putative cyclin 9 n=1 Tax=Leptomonas pyrrhocoris TaxID=157538 RepID=A0A0M9G855_LEPPY|nr:putative cyclin 9 [Leptomonas pyrrhocoris]KPA84583.1 putative cyclin 9 [Leptomonas pyrrhocoris]|eukprot:XP_015663022.1 putative cyclin 9 [Leptomonas pyrrhocoris]